MHKLCLGTPNSPGDEAHHFLQCWCQHAISQTPSTGVLWARNCLLFIPTWNKIQCQSLFFSYVPSSIIIYSLCYLFPSHQTVIYQNAQHKGKKHKLFTSIIHTSVINIAPVQVTGRIRILFPIMFFIKDLLFQHNYYHPFGLIDVLILEAIFYIFSSEIVNQNSFLNPRKKLVLKILHFRIPLLPSQKRIPVGNRI